MKKNLFYILCILCTLSLGFTACSDDDDDKDKVAIRVSETKFYADANDLIKVSFTVSPSGYAVTDQNLSLGISSLNISGTGEEAGMVPSIIGLKKGSNAGEWIASIKFVGTGYATVNFTLDGKHFSESFTITNTRRVDLYTVSQVILWKRSDPDFVTKESTINLSEVIAECGGIKGLSSVGGFFSAVTEGALEQDFCLGNLNVDAQTFTATMVDDEVALNGHYYWIYTYTRTNGSRFQILIILKIED